MTHCCHSPQAPCRARQTSKAAPCHLTCSLSANQPILPQIKPVKSLLAWALSSWCPSAREGQQSRRRRRLALSLVASQGRDNAGCKWPPDRLPASHSAFLDRGRAADARRKGCYPEHHLLTKSQSRAGHLRTVKCWECTCLEGQRSTKSVFLHPAGTVPPSQKRWGQDGQASR